MSELLPCPFCGGEAEILTADSVHSGLIAGIMCNSCSARSDVYDTEAEAIAAWNTRADYHGYEQAAVDAWKRVKAYQERTCHAELNESCNAVICSECGSSELLRWWDEIKNWEGSECISTFTTHKYCPNCGAKVVEQ